MLYPRLCKAVTKKIPPLFCAAGPAPQARGRRPLSCFAAPQACGFQYPIPMAAPCLVPRLREPPYGVSLRCSGSPAVCLRGSASPCGSCSTAPRALAVSLRSSGSPHASPAASRWSPFATPQALTVLLRLLRSRLRRLLAALGALRSPRVFFLSFPRKRESRRSGLHSFVIHTMRQTHGRFCLQCLQ